MPVDMGELFDTCGMVADSQGGWLIEIYLKCEVANRLGFSANDFRQHLISRRIDRYISEGAIKQMMKGMLGNDVGRRLDVVVAKVCPPVPPDSSDSDGPPEGTEGPPVVDRDHGGSYRPY